MVTDENEQTATEKPNEGDDVLGCVDERSADWKLGIGIGSVRVKREQFTLVLSSGETNVNASDAESKSWTN